MDEDNKDRSPGFALMALFWTVAAAHAALLLWLAWMWVQLE